MGHWVDDDRVVMVTPTRIRMHTGTGDWVVPTAPASGAIDTAGSVGVSACEYKSSMFVAAGGSYWHSSDAGVNWTERVIVARHFVVFDQKLVKISAAGAISWATADPPTVAGDWTAKTSALLNHTINGMIVWRDGDDAPAIIIATTRGLYIFDFDADRLYSFPPSWSYGETYHAWQMAIWNQDLYVADNRSVLRVTDSGITNVGPDKDDGFDSVMNGRIRWLLPLQNWLIVCIDNAGITTRVASIWAYNGRGWHNLTVVPSNNDITALAFRNNLLFYNNGAAQSRYLTFTDTSESPLEIATSTYTGGGLGASPAVYLQSPYFDGGLANVDKNALAVVIEVQNMISGDGVAVYYAVNSSTSYTQLGSDILSVAGNGQTTLNFGTGAIGQTIRDISFRVGLLRASGTTTATPVVVSAKLRYMEVPSQLYAYTFAVDLRGGQGNENMTQRANLITAKNAQTLVVLQLGNPTQSITGRVTQMQGVRNDKNERLPGIYNITFVQPV